MAAACSNTCLQLVERAFSQEKKNDYFDTINNIIKGIQDEHLKFYECVECLGPYLTDTDVVSRKKGVEVLKDIVEKLPKSYLNELEVGKLTVFFSDRLKDSDLVVSEALQGLVSLSVNKHLTGAGLSLMLNGIFQDVYTQTRLQKDRYCVLIVLKNALHFHLEDVKAMGLDFVCGFIQTIDGEKDPRNLMIAFNLIPIVIRNFNIDSVAEELFELCGRYFPIDYFPPEDDPRGITREDLLLGLRSCLSATPKFAEYCLPMLMEKLDSELQSAKLDSLQTLAACVGVYGFNNLKPFYSDIWKSIRREIFSGAVVELEKAALTTLCETLMTLEPAVEEKLTEVIEDVLENIIKECVSYLNLPDMKLYIPTAKLLKAVSISSLGACERLLTAVMPFCLGNCTPAKQQTRREVFFGVINFLLEGSLLHLSANGKHPLDTYKQSLLNLYIETLSECLEGPLKLTLIRGLSEMTSAISFLNEVELLSVAQSLAQDFVIEQQSTISSAYKNLLSNISKARPYAMLPLLSKIMSSIESGTFENNAKDNSNTNPSTLKKHLMLVVAFLKDNEGLTLVIPTLMNKLKWSVAVNDTKMTDNLLQCLIDIVGDPVVSSAHSSFWYHQVLLPLLQVVIHRSQVVDEYTLELLRHVAHVIQALVPHLDISESSLILFDALKFYLGHNRVIVDEVAIKSDAQSRKFAPGTFSILLVESIINSVKKDLFYEQNQVSLENYDCFLSDTIKLIQSLDVSDCEVLSACRSIGSLLNKLPEGEFLEKQVAVVLNTVCHKNLGCSSVSSERVREQIVLLLLWSIKAMLLRGHRITEKFLEELFNYLGDESVTRVVSEKCDIILSESQVALNMQLHCNIRCLYKQRLFVMTSARLINAFHTSNEKTKYSYMTVLIKIATELPKEVLLPEMSSMLPVLIKGLITSDPLCLTGLLSLLVEILEHSPNLLESYVDGLITHLLHLATFKSTMKVRIMALMCLEKLTTFPTHILVKHKDVVLSHLVICLDDHKRLVRRAAVETRCKWFLIGSPGGS